MARRYVSRTKTRDNIQGYTFISPWIFGFLLFTIVPMICLVAFSLCYVDFIDGSYVFEFRGFDNYVTAFIGSSNVLFVQAIYAFLQMEITYVPVVIIVAFVIAMILNSNIKGKGFFRVLFFLPVIIISGQLMENIFASALGTSIDFANEAEVLTGQSPELLVSPVTESFLYRMIDSFSSELADVITYVYDQFVIILWFIGIPVILFINGLQKINKNLYEAAQIDGATKWQILWKIIIPNIRYLAAVVSVFVVVQLSIMPTSALYNFIMEFMTADDSAAQKGLIAAYTVIYAILILMFVAIFFFIFIPREKKVKEVITRVQKEQLDITLARMEEEGI